MSDTPLWTPVYDPNQPAPPISSVASTPTPNMSTAAPGDMTAEEAFRKGMQAAKIQQLSDFSGQDPASRAPDMSGPIDPNSSKVKPISSFVGQPNAIPNVPGGPPSLLKDPDVDSAQSYSPAPRVSSDNALGSQFIPDSPTVKKAEKKDGPMAPLHTPPKASQKTIDKALHTVAENTDLFQDTERGLGTGRIAIPPDTSGTYIPTSLAPSTKPGAPSPGATPGRASPGGTPGASIPASAEEEKLGLTPAQRGVVSLDPKTGLPMVGGSSRPASGVGADHYMTTTQRDALEDANDQQARAMRPQSPQSASPAGDPNRPGGAMGAYWDPKNNWMRPQNQQEILDGAQQRQAGTEAVARDEADAAKARVDFFAQQAQQQQALEDTRQKALADRKMKMDAAGAQVDHLSEEARNTKVTADYWQRQDIGTRILAGIGGALGGVLQGQQGGENQFLKFMDKVKQDDIDAQKANLNNKWKGVDSARNTLGDMRARFGDDIAAEAATKIAMNERIATQLLKMGAESDSKVVMDRAQQAIGQVKQENATLKATIQDRAEWIVPQQGVSADFAAGGKPTEERMEKYGERMEKEGIPAGRAALNGLDAVIQPFGTGDIPGIGMGSNILEYISPSLLSDEARQTRAKVQSLIVELRHTITGSSMTDGEKSEYEKTIGSLRSASDIRAFVNRYRAKLAAQQKSLDASTNPKIVAAYRARGGDAPIKENEPTRSRVPIPGEQ